jgi:hypothetical protein
VNASVEVGEFALSVLTYNLKRVINILGVHSLLEPMKAVAAHF